MLTKPLKDAVGEAFKLTSGSTEIAQDKEGNVITVPRAVYKVTTLNSNLLPVNTELTVKIKGIKCILTKQDNMKLLFNQKLVTVAFDNLSFWTFSGNEGLSASAIRVLELSQGR